MRLALHPVGSTTYYFSATPPKSVNVIGSTVANELFFFVSANPKKGVYGDEPQTLDYVVTYGGATDPEGVAWANRPDISGALACMDTNADPNCALDANTVPGSYDITQGSLALDYYDKLVDGVTYYYTLVFIGAQYTVDNAEFSVEIPDIWTYYTGDTFNPGTITPVATGVRNGQTVCGPQTCETSS